MKALIFEDKVVQTSETPFEVHDSMHWIDCPNECEAGKWSVIDGVLQETPEPESIVLTWVESRLCDYPSIQECVHAMLDGDLDELQAKRQEVKARFPK
jgi:hypothetical protein